MKDLSKMLKNVWRLSLFCMLASLSACFVDDIDEDAEGRRLNDAQIQEYIQTNGLNAQSTGSGLYYAVSEAFPSAQVMEVGDSVKVHFIARLLSGSIVDSTEGSTQVLEGVTPLERFNRPDELLLSISPIATGLEEALLELKEGERASVLVPSYLAFGANGTTLIPPFSVLIYDILILDVRSEEEQIEEYLSLNNLVPTQVTESGLRYIRLEEGSPGTQPELEDAIRVVYKGTRLDGVAFDDNSDTLSVFNLRSGAGGLVEGWVEAFQLMNQGERVVLVFPSSLGYGANGQNAQAATGIPQYAPIAFEILYVKTEELQIEEYIAANALTNLQSTESGLQYLITENGTGNQPVENSIVRVSIKASSIDYEDQVNEFLNDGNKTFDLEEDALAQDLSAGLKESILDMQVGESRLVIANSALAYVNNTVRRGGVRSQAPVIYEIELLEIL